MAAKRTTPVFGQQALVTSERTGNTVANLLRLAILEGRLAPGEVLQEVQLGQELGISRTPIREALIELRNEGLLETTPTRRIAVRSYTGDELRDIYDLRATLEGFAAKMAALRSNDALLRRLDESNARFHAIASDGSDEDVTSQLIVENMSFHDVIATAAGIARLQKMIEQVMTIPRRYRAYAAYVPEHREVVVRDHRAITEAIRQGDGDAAGRQMEDHVRWTGAVAVAAQAAYDADQAAL